MAARLIYFNSPLRLTRFQGLKYNMMDRLIGFVLCGMIMEDTALEGVK